MILRTLRSIGKNTHSLYACSSFMKLNEKVPLFLTQAKTNANLFYQFNSKHFSSNTQNIKANLDGLISELESQDMENFEEPFV